MPASPLHVESLDHLRKIELIAVSRLNEKPRVAQLFLVDPIGALAAVGVILSPNAIEEWRKLVGRLPSLPKKTFTLVEKSSAPLNLKVTIRGLLPPPGTPVD